MSKGKLIVIEGIDGSGKSTQYKLLQQRLTSDGIPFHSIVFPRYQEESSALIRLYLGGQFGMNPSDVNGYAASTFFAVDRYASYQQDWKSAYENGMLILADRYTTSNAVHQGCKFNDEDKPSFFNWLSDFEYEKLGLPKPDLVIYQDVTLELSVSRLRAREDATNTHADIHEMNIDYLSSCLHSADFACSHYGWTRIPYNLAGCELDVNKKNEMIYSIIRSFITE